MKFILIFILSLNYTYGSWIVYDKNELGELNDKIRYFYLDNSDNIWIGTGSSYGIYKFDGINSTYYDTTNTPLPYTDISCITQAPNGDMYFGTYNDNSSNKLTSIIFYNGINWNYLNRLNSTLDIYSVRDILPIGENEFWIATEVGLYYYNMDVVELYFDKEDIYSRHIVNIVNDKNDIIYVTNLRGDVYSCDLNKNKLVFNKISTPTKVNNYTARCYIDSTNNLWRFYPNILEKRDENKWVRFDSTTFDMNNPYTLYISRKGRILSNTFKDVYEYIDNNWIKILEIPELIVENNDSIYNDNGVNRLHLEGIDSKGNFIFVPRGKPGLIKYSPETNSIRKELNISIYPNPSQSKITVNTDQQITELALYTINLTKVSDFAPKHTTSQEIDISTLSSGIYFIKVNDDFIKFVKE